MSLSSWYNRLPGMALALGLALTAYWLGGRFPLVGGPVFGILLGMLVSNLVGIRPPWQPGIAFTSKKILQTAIVLLGGGLSLMQVWQTGKESLVVMLTTLASALAMAFLLGRLMKVRSNLAALVGVGTAICGASAIAAIAPIIEADDGEVAYSISTVFFFNVLAVLIFPPLGHLLGLSQAAFGLWSGTAINDTSSVVAAAYSFGEAAGAYATIVKLTRTTMIIPIAFFMAAYISFCKCRQARTAGEAGFKVARIVPWFILWFLMAALLNTAGIIGPALAAWATASGKFLIIMALAAVGLGADFRRMVRSGYKPLVLGLLIWVTVALTSLLAQRLTGQI